MLKSMETASGSLNAIVVLLLVETLLLLAVDGLHFAVRKHLYICTHESLGIAIPGR